ncbi:CD48 antigen isoform X7 [Labeo rohita]|uniref:CD48 antigen isoform X7 n=1 Tax=Labeo rohita TaxID=84645 RepID=UPI0021E3356E|nr:CD48 antigen isoform X7 [Labeo rohita]
MQNMQSGCSRGQRLMLSSRPFKSRIFPTSYLEITSGCFLFRFRLERGIITAGLCDTQGVFGADAGAGKSIPVMEGDSVTLKTKLKVQGDDQILWMFEVNNSDTRIAEIYKLVISIYDSNEIFKNRLQIDNQTGSLTIRNIRTEHTGLYKLQILTKEKVTYRIFSVIMHARLPVHVISSNSSSCSSSSSSGSSNENCSLVCSVVNVSDVEYQDKNTYSCVINNPISNQTKHLNISQLCHKCAERHHLYTIMPVVVAVVTLLVVFVVLGLQCLRARTIQEQQKAVQTSEEEIHYEETTFSEHSVRSMVRNIFAVCSASVCLLKPQLLLVELYK